MDVNLLREALRVSDLSTPGSVRDSLSALVGDLDQVSRYALDRLVRSFVLWEETSWDQGVLLREDELNELLREFVASSAHDRVRLSLRAEYDTVLQELQDVLFRVVSVAPSALVRPARGHRPVDHAAFDLSVPVALVASDGLRVIDGYHRTASALRLGLRSVEVVQVVL